MKSIVFIDTEVSVDEQKAYDYGAIDSDGNELHTGRLKLFNVFMEENEYVCGHNLIDHDAQYVGLPEGCKLVDTLYLSPLIFPNRSYHSLLKDDKLKSEELNNPLHDSKKAMNLFYEEVNAFNALSAELKSIYYTLLKDNPYFMGFWSYVEYSQTCDVVPTVLSYFQGKVCEHAPLDVVASNSPTELAYCLALISTAEENLILPKWVQMHFSKVDSVLHTLRNTPCKGCAYCNERLNPHKYLNRYFGYEGFRKYNGEPLQEDAVTSAVMGESLLAIFPTGGGKSLTFQIPALMAGETEAGLTVVISPLQSLMKDQVYSLEKKQIASAVMINGLLNPIERAEAIERVESGVASILYISPENLRSYTIERLLLSRHISRFVIDEAHCFSAWGQDFRVDYLYIGDYIRELQEKKGNGCKIPVSCFTATAKQKVVTDIKDYFKKKLGLDLKLFATNASRTNLRYEVQYIDTDAKKYETLRSLIQAKDCPTIVYASRTKKTLEIAKKLCMDGFKARPFNGKMDSSEKQTNQEAFINDEVQIIVATSAFGMGVDKSNVGLVVHYDISDSLENYVQEAGRAGRDQSIDAECYVLFKNDDLDKHFMLLNQTKLSMGEIQQVWKAIKALTKTRPQVCCSPLEIAREAGWDESKREVETRVKTAILALENAGYIQRGKNSPKVYATSIVVKNMEEASKRIEESMCFESEDERTTAKRIIKSLISSKSISKADNADAESRVDYLADRLGLERLDVIRSIQQMRNDGLLADTKDLTAYIDTSKSKKGISVRRKLKEYHDLEDYLLDTLDDDGFYLDYKELNNDALSYGIKSAKVATIKTIFYYWTIRGYVQKTQDETTERVTLVPQLSLSELKTKRAKVYTLAEYIVSYLYDLDSNGTNDHGEALVQFSILDVINAYQKDKEVLVSAPEVEEALLFLSKINTIKLEGGFLVLYNAIQLKRLVLNNAIQYKVDDYRQLNEFYKQKIQQIHIIGEYANIMVKDYDQAQKYVNDYFQMDYQRFISKYFDGEKAEQIQHNITPQKYHELFDTLSPQQLEIVRDDTSKHIVCTAGPGSGKTRVLVHKLASLLLMEDVKHEQLLMLTFSRNAVNEFRQRLRELIGNATAFVEINTFHSYCFDLLGKVGSLEDANTVVKDATELIKNKEVDLGRITKSVLVIDEAQDMDEHEFALVQALMERNEYMRIIAVGDDDQNIYEFRGSSSKYLKSLITEHHAKHYDLVDNYRSTKAVVGFANAFAKSINDRLKSTDIKAVSEDTGEVKLIKHTCNYMEDAIVDDVISTANTGSTCVLTSTNQEALNVLGILNRNGVKANLIQSNDNVQLTNILEIRYFIAFIKKFYGDEPIFLISDECWNSSIKKLKINFKDSECLPLILDILQTFSDNHPYKYLADLRMFLSESNFEDFYRQEEGVVTVSTIHKSKGKEFDNVYILLREPIERPLLQDDADKRKVYVGITRAKSRLHIHYNSDALDTYQPNATEYSIDSKFYSKPAEITMQPSYHDVYLDFFKFNDRQEIIAKLYSGYPLQVNIQNGNISCEYEGQEHIIGKFSYKYSKILNDRWLEGYLPCSAKARLIVFWKKEEDTKWSRIVFPTITLKYTGR